MADTKKLRFSKHFFVFFGCFWAYVEQPYGHISWATSMPFVSINAMNSRTNPWHFGKFFFENWVFWKAQFFRVGHFEIFCFNFFFCFVHIKIIQSLLVSKDGSRFWSNQTWQHFLTHAKHFYSKCTSPSTHFVTLYLLLLLNVSSVVEF